MKCLKEKVTTTDEQTREWKMTRQIEEDSNETYY